MSKVNEFCSKLKFSKNCRDFGLLIHYDEKNRPILSIGNSDSQVLLRRFKGKFDMNKFLVESVLLHMCVHNSELTIVRQAFNNISNFLNDEESSENEKI